MIVDVNIDGETSIYVSVIDGVDGEDLYKEILLDPDVANAIGDRIIIKHIYIPGDSGVRKLVPVMRISTMKKGTDYDKAFAMPRRGRIPERDIDDGYSYEKTLEVGEYNFKYCTTNLSGNLATLMQCLKMSDAPFELYNSHSNEIICLPCVPDNEEQDSVMLVFDKSGQFVDLLVNNKSIKPTHRKRRHNPPDNIREKIIMKCVNTINAYIKCYTPETAKQRPVGRSLKMLSYEERSMLEDLVNNRESLADKMGLRNFVELVGNLTFELNATLSYIDRHNIK